MKAPDYLLPPETLEALHAAGSSLNLNRAHLAPQVMARCVACHLRRGETVKTSSIQECVGLARTAVAHALKGLVEESVLRKVGEGYSTSNGTGKPYNIYDAPPEIKPILNDVPPLSHCEK